MSKWASIIYGRTYEVDFRLLVKPEDFGSSEEEWAKSHILVTMRWAEKLTNHPRWSVFKNDHYCIFGVTCMASEISEDMIYDIVGRPLFVFVGYVARTPYPFIPPTLNLDLVKDQYESYVRPRWLEQDNQKIEMDQRSRSKYEALKYLESNSSEQEALHSLVTLNTKSNCVSLWPDSEAYNQKLWLSACQSPMPISLCLSLARQKDALKSSPFLNVTTSDATQYITLEKEIQKQASVQTKPVSDQTGYADREPYKNGEQVSASEQSLSKFVGDVTSVVETFSGAIGLISNIIKNRTSKNNKQRQKEEEQMKNLDTPELIQDSSEKQHNMYSRFFKAEDQSKDDLEDN